MISRFGNSVAARECQAVCVVYELIFILDSLCIVVDVVVVAIKLNKTIVSVNSCAVEEVHVVTHTGEYALECAVLIKYPAYGSCPLRFKECGNAGERITVYVKRIGIAVDLLNVGNA